MDGIIGLGFASLSTNDLKPFLDSAINLDDKSFSFYFKKDSEQSYMFIPGYDESDNYTKIATHKLIEENYWTLNLTGMKVGSKTISSEDYEVILDSGTSLIVGPKAIIDPLIGDITIKEDCSDDRSKLPDISFTIDNTDYTLKAEDYIIETFDHVTKKCMLAI